MDLIKITTTNELNDIKDPVDGQVAYIENDNGNEYFLYQNKAWFPVQGEMTSSGLQLNLYELNRNIISQLPDFEDSQWEGAESVFKEWLEGKTCKYSDTGHTVPARLEGKPRKHKLPLLYKCQKRTCKISCRSDVDTSQSDATRAEGHGNVSRVVPTIVSA